MNSLLDPLGELLGDGPLALLELVLGLGAQDVASPLDAGAVVVLRLEGVDQLGKLTLVLLRMCNMEGSVKSICLLSSCVYSFNLLPQQVRLEC